MPSCFKCKWVGEQTSEEHIKCMRHGLELLITAGCYEFEPIEQIEIKKLKLPMLTNEELKTFLAP